MRKAAGACSRIPSEIKLCPPVWPGSVSLLLNCHFSVSGRVPVGSEILALSWHPWGPDAVQKVQASCPCEAQPGLGTGSCEGVHGCYWSLDQSKEVRNMLGTEGWGWHMARFSSPHQPSLSKG